MLLYIYCIIETCNNFYNKGHFSQIFVLLNEIVIKILRGPGIVSGHRSRVRVRNKRPRQLLFANTVSYGAAYGQKCCHDSELLEEL